MALIGGSPTIHVKIAVIHHTLDMPSGGERVCLSLLGALDRTRHETVLRCVVPPLGVRFAGNSGNGSPLLGGCPPHPAFRRVRLDLVHSRGSGTSGAGGALDLAAEYKTLFRRTGCDIVVVTDGGLIMERTDAPRIVWYCNTALRSEMRILSLPWPRHPRNILRMLQLKRPSRRMIAATRGKKVTSVPNSEYTRREVSAAVGRPVRGPTVYPPVDLRRFGALWRMPMERRTVTVARFGPEKNLGAAARIMREAGGGYDIVGNENGVANQLETIGEVRRSASAQTRLHINAGRGVLERVVGGAKVYLQTSEETFGIAVVEAIAAGCVPVVPDNSAHPETVPFEELRYRTEGEAVEVVRGALDGRFDGLLPALQEHIQRFSEEAFQEAMLGIIEGGRDV